MENIKETDLVITLIAGTSIIFILASLMVYIVITYQRKVQKQREILRLTEKKYQNELLDATISTAEMERDKIAKNIHDDIGTSLNIILNNHHRLSKIAKDPETQKILDTNSEVLKEIEESVRTISNDLMSPTLNKLGFIKTLKQLCWNISRSNVIELTLNNSEQNLHLQSKTEVQLYRICKEALNNILKHSNSSVIRIDLEQKDSYFNIYIRYNGKGINDEDSKMIIEKTQGLGLRSMYGRAQVLNAKLNYITEDNKDALIRIQLPLI